MSDEKREILQLKTPFGERITMLRRYLAIAMGEDLTPKRMNEILGFSNGLWGRYESGEILPRKDKIEAAIALAQKYGLTWATPEWLDWGAGEGPPQVGEPVEKPVPTRPKAVLGERKVDVEDERKARARKKKNPRRA